MSRVIRGTLRLEMQPTALSSVLEAAVDSVRPTAAARGIAVAVHDCPGTIVSADHHPHPAGHLEPARQCHKVHAARRAGRSTHRGRGRRRGRENHRHGGGHRPRIPAARVRSVPAGNGGHHRTHSGLGIGLALVRHLTELHGGIVTAESAGKGQGSAFSIRLPLVGTSAATSGADASAASAELVGVHVLAVDDDLDARDLMATTLRQAGARVTTAESVAEATAAAGGEEIHVVLTDIAMPNDSGYDLLRAVRADPRTAAAPVVAITAYTRPQDRERAMAAGFDAQVTKPFHPKQLVELVAALARKAAG